MAQYNFMIAKGMYMQIKFHMNVISFKALSIVDSFIFQHKSAQAAHWGVVKRKLCSCVLAIPPKTSTDRHLSIISYNSGMIVNDIQMQVNHSDIQINNPYFFTLF